LLVDESMVRACEDRRDFWTMLRAIARLDRTEPSVGEMEQRIRAEIIGKITQGLERLASTDANATKAQPPSLTLPDQATADADAQQGAATPDADGYMAPWIDSDECTACDECTRINPAIFKYDDRKKAYIADPQAGPYSDLVKAAEKCTAQIIHPGLPRDRSLPDIEKWIARGSKYN
jgi:pyruvate-ferredoxin/flavodoxin oxidoreductase